MHSGGEEEPEEESHTPLPPPMQIIKDPNNPEVRQSLNVKLFYVFVLNSATAETVIMQHVWAA